MGALRQWGRWWCLVRSVQDDAPAMAAWTRSAAASLVESATRAGHTVVGEVLWLDPLPVVVDESFQWHPWDVRFGDPDTSEWLLYRAQVPVIEDPTNQNQSERGQG